jgi:3'-5' exoribonuclease
VDPDIRLYTAAQLKGLGSETTGMSFASVFLQNKVTSRTAKNGSEFLVAELSDATGSITVNCFSGTPLFAFFKSGKDGQVIQVQGQTDYYQDRLSPRLLHVAALSDEAIAEGNWLSKLIPSSTENPSGLWEELLSHIQAIEHPQLQATVQRVMDEIAQAFQQTPGAISMHHAYRHGLMEHTVHMARVAKALLPIYPEVHKDLALAGVLLHDIGKTIEYTGERVTKKSQAGILQGHVVLGYRMTRKAAIQSGLDEVLLERLEHIILSHQGELEWGAAVMAATPEAVFVSLVDNLDAKMGIVQNALRTTPEGFSAFLPGLKTTLLTTPIESGN